MEARIDVHGGVDFGSGGCGCSLINVATGEKIEGAWETRKIARNGFVSIRSQIVDLPPETEVEFHRYFRPGSSVKFKGSWEDLVSQTKFPLVMAL